MAQYLTAAEAASRLNMSVDDLNDLAKKREIRAFSEKGSGFKFREEDVDEYASAHAQSGADPFEAEADPFAGSGDPFGGGDPFGDAGDLFLGTGDAADEPAEFGVADDDDSAPFTMDDSSPSLPVEEGGSGDLASFEIDDNAETLNPEIEMADDELAEVEDLGDDTGFEMDMGLAAEPVEELETIEEAEGFDDIGIAASEPASGDGMGFTFDAEEDDAAPMAEDASDDAMSFDMADEDNSTVIESASDFGIEVEDDAFAVDDEAAAPAPGDSAAPMTFEVEGEDDAFAFGGEEAVPSAEDSGAAMSFEMEGEEAGDFAAFDSDEPAAEAELPAAEGGDDDLGMSFDLADEPAAENEDDFAVNLEEGGEQLEEMPTMVGSGSASLADDDMDFDFDTGGDAGAEAAGDLEEASDFDMGGDNTSAVGMQPIDDQGGFDMEATSDFELSDIDNSGAADDDSEMLESEDADETQAFESVKLEEDDDIFGDAGDDITARGPESGINLASPIDSGLSLDAEGADSDFELSLEEDAEPSNFDNDEFEVPGFKDDDEDSELELSDDDTEADAEAGGEEDSDFELAIDEEQEAEEESGSEVVAIDDEDEDAEDSADDDEEDEDEDEDDDEDAEDEEEDQVALARPGAVMAAPAPWPGFLVIPLLATTAVLAFVGMMMYEVMRSAWSHNSPYTMNATLIKMVYGWAKDFGIAN